MKGYTLVELIVVMVIIGIVAAIGVPIMLKAVDVWSFSSRFQTNAVMSSVSAMHRMSKEIRRLKNDTSVITATAGGSTYSFVDINNNQITYRLNGTTLERGVGATPVYDGLLDNVQSLSFQYFNDISSTPLSTILVSPSGTNVRLVEVSFSVLAGSNTLSFRFKSRYRNVSKVTVSV
jgi:prepilin-type N-terminal cleavage/methylation domain-containing protein